jgi:ferritin-like metal-binding protein YciE
MTNVESKIAQYLFEARAMEEALARTLEAHRSVAAPGPYRDALDHHLLETRIHGDRIAARLRELDRSPSVVEVGYGLVQRTAGQLLALGKAPLDMVRGASVEEKRLKNAKDECATEALEIATYDALEQLARQAGDERTAALAAENRDDEERMLAALRKQIPELTAAVVGAETPVIPANPAAVGEHESRPHPQAVAPKPSTPRRAAGGSGPARRSPAPRRAPAARPAGPATP